MRKADRVIRMFLPKEERFHEVLARDTENLTRAVKLFSEIAHTSSFEERRIKVVELKHLEHEGDMITKEVFNALNSSFITPFDPDDIRVTIRLNGKEMFTYAVKDAIFGVRQFISRMSQYLTLYPGDVLWMGTDGATENMKDGDVVEVEIPGIGVLRNPIVRER